MNTKEIKIFRKKVRDILKEDDSKQRHKELVLLAKEVGAGYVHTKFSRSTVTEFAKGREIISDYDPISESELVLNINDALQTESMINTCKIASRSWIVAIFASTISFVALIVSGIATDIFLS